MEVSCEDGKWMELTSRSCPMTNFGISDIGPSGCTTAVLVVLDERQQFAVP